jgi:hypothetical protein
MAYKLRDPGEKKHRFRFSIHKKSSDDDVEKLKKENERLTREVAELVQLISEKVLSLLQKVNTF